MIGVLMEDKLGLVKKSDKSLYKKILFFDEGPGFYKTEKVLKLYNTMTNFLKKAEINEDLLNKFIEINHCMNTINTLKLNSYEHLIPCIDKYQEMHENIEVLWEKPVLDDKNIFAYDIYDMKELEENEYIEIFNKIYNKELDIDNVIFCKEADNKLSCIVSNDIFNQNRRKLYMFIENFIDDLDKDIAYSFKYLIQQVSKIDISYDDDLSLLDMTRLGLNAEHIFALNNLMTAYNYLINSSSFRDNKRISNAKLTVERVPLVIKSRLEMYPQYTQRKAD